MNIHIQKVDLLPREILEARFPTFIAFLIFIFPNTRPEFRTLGRNFERSAGISNVWQKFRRPAEIPNDGGPF